MSKFLTTAASAVILMAAAGAYAYDNRNDDHHTQHNAGQYSAIQKGQSASTKAYGYNKQGDHYNARNVHRDKWNESRAYPGQGPVYGAKDSVVIRKGGSGISDSSSAAVSRQYGSYWN